MVIHSLYVSPTPIPKINQLTNPSIHKHHDISHNRHDRRRHHKTRTRRRRSRQHRPLPRLLSSLQHRLRLLRPRSLLRPNGRTQEPQRLHKIPPSPTRHRHGPVHHRRTRDLPVRRQRCHLSSTRLRLTDGRESRIRNLPTDYHHRRCHQRPHRLQVCLLAYLPGYRPHAQARLDRHGIVDRHCSRAVDLGVDYFLCDSRVQ